VQGSCPDYAVGFVPQALKAALQQVCRLDLEAEAEAGAGAAGLSFSAPKLPRRRLVPVRLPPPPGIYNLLVQHSAELVAPPLRPLMTDPLSSVGWLYAHGCRCATCGALYAELRPLAQAVSKLGALGKPALNEGTPEADAMAAAQTLMAAAAKRQAEHEAAAHGGAHVHFNQVPH
jgi:hypothetical protein